MVWGWCALTRHQIEQLDALQRRMLRLIVGRIRIDDEATTKRRMRDRVNGALTQYAMAPWSEQLASRQYQLARRIASQRHSWP